MAFLLFCIQVSIIVLNLEVSIVKGQPWSSLSTNISHVENNVEKSPNDNRLYRGVVLKNGMKLMLVSDPNANFASACLTVGVGT